MGSCAAPSAKGDDKFITTDYLQQCQNIINKIECCSVDNLQSLLSIIAAKMKSMIYQK
uniref:hypothetical protein n=1 Tax=Escherichia coli TaxID=562 RepID=UPI002357B9DC|nr:hypothetical protein [Escherichia coli]